MESEREHTRSEGGAGEKSASARAPFLVITVVARLGREHTPPRGCFLSRGEAWRNTALATHSAGPWS